MLLTERRGGGLQPLGIVGKRKAADRLRGLGVISACGLSGSGNRVARNSTFANLRCLYHFDQDSSIFDIATLKPRRFDACSVAAIFTGLSRAEEGSCMH
jgi:hypothetical protein